MIDAYNDTAERFVKAVDLSIEADLLESGGFLTYHAFESAGGALVLHFGQRYSKSHKAKLNQFTQAAKRLRNEYIVANLVIQLASARSGFLYPKLKPNGTVVRPRDVITRTQAVKLRKRVAWIVRWVRGVT